MRYAIRFTKSGYAVYTSHLDMTRLFKRAFKRADIRLAYSQGFNPHPKMGFAQPLSLGYFSEQEYLEFETQQELLTAELCSRLESCMPAGIGIAACVKLGAQEKPIAARVYASEYAIEIPLPEGFTLRDGFVEQHQITAWKRQKKSKEKKQVDIRPMIRSFSVRKVDDKLFMEISVDAGSESNLSPELVLQAFLEYQGLTETERGDIRVTRTKLHF